MSRLTNFVGEGGLEPPRPEGHWHLKPARLPFRHSPKQPVEPTTVGAVIPNRADVRKAAIRRRPPRRRIQFDLDRCDSQSSAGAAALRWPDSMLGYDTRDATRRRMVCRGAAIDKD
jgi:hypothetical protein